MKKLIMTLLGLVVMATAISLCIATILIAVIGALKESAKAAEPLQYEPGTEIIDRRYTLPDTYEALDRTTFENGLSVERWESVSKQNYYAIKKDNTYDYP